MDKTLLAVDWKRGKVVWRFEPERPFPFYSSPAVSGDLVVVGCRDRAVYALDAKTGKQRWRTPTRGKVDSSPVIAGSHVYVGSSDGPALLPRIRQR
jgi:outer membrane protein assembly factor BamB